MTVLLIAVVALAMAIIAKTVLEPWAPSPRGRENGDPSAADERAREMEAIALSCF